MNRLARPARSSSAAGTSWPSNSRSIVGFVAGRGEPLIVGDTTKDPTYYPNPLLPDTRSEAAVPLRVGERIVGVMDVQSSNLYAFEEEDVRTLQILADQLAVAVVNSELFAETQEHLSQHRLLQHITTTAASGTTLEEALDGAVTGLQVTLGGDRVSILLLDRETQKLEIRAAVGYSDEIFALQIPVGSGHYRLVGGARAGLARGRCHGRLTLHRGQPKHALPSWPYRSVPQRGAGRAERRERADWRLHRQRRGDAGNAGRQPGGGHRQRRLLEQVRGQAERERVLFEITGKIRRAPDIQTILATTASELTRVVGAQRAQIRVSTEGTNGEAAKEE